MERQRTRTDYRLGHRPVLEEVIITVTFTKDTKDNNSIFISSHRVTEHLLVFLMPLKCLITAAEKQP